VCDDARVHRQEGRIGILSAQAVVLVGAAVGILLTLAIAAPSPAAADQPTVFAQVGDTTSGQAMPPGFVGVSLEYKAMHLYTGRDPRAVNPVLVHLLARLAPGQHPELRIGGNSTDSTWWPVRGVIPPGGISYGLTKGWLRTTQALARALGARLIVGINLASGRPALAGAEARSILHGIGRRYIQALEIGNEPDLYGTFAWYRNRRGRLVFSRPASYDFADFLSDFARWRAALPSVPLAGPAVSSLNWMGGLDGFLASEPAVRVVTLHRYPLRACTTAPAAPAFTSIANLMLDSSSFGLAQGVAPFVTTAHAHGAQFRLDELNSAACSGRLGVSNTFASALWALDALFNLAAVGVDGVNIHTLPKAPYEPFTFARRGSTWSAFVHPVYYGLLMFAQAFPPGARLLTVTAPGGYVKVWATVAPDGHTRVVLINKQATTPVRVHLQLAGIATTATVAALRAPAINSVSGVTLAGRTFGLKTTTGELRGSPRTTPLSPAGGTYDVELPAASAVLLTL
jgi:Glycosyl hydrolase family 79 C-terminal beta domain